MTTIKSISTHCDSLMQELKEAAFEALLLNPGSEFVDWRDILCSQYGTEVVDALGTDPEVAYAGIADMWEAEYLDHNTGISQKFSEWAMAFANEYSVAMYHRLLCPVAHTYTHTAPYSP